MGKVLDHLKLAVGTWMVRTGIQLVSRDEEPSEDEVMVGPVAVLSDTAREMIADGLTIEEQPRVSSSEVLGGSFADRMRMARREMGR